MNGNIFLRIKINYTTVSDKIRVLHMRCTLRYHLRVTKLYHRTIQGDVKNNWAPEVSIRNYLWDVGRRNCRIQCRGMLLQTEKKNIHNKPKVNVLCIHLCHGIYIYSSIGHVVIVDVIFRKKKTWNKALNLRRAALWECMRWFTFLI